MDTPELMANKSTARAWARAQVRAATSKPEGDWASSLREVWGIVREHGGFPGAPANSVPVPILMAFVPILGEPDPMCMLSDAAEAGWRIAVGRGTSRTSTLQVVAIDPAAIGGGRWHRDQCEPDAWGMAVPRDRVPASSADVAAVVVPGMAFDRTGHRLGRGAGVYDRFLATLPPTALRVGLVPSNRLVDRLPVDPHDVPMHVVATEREVLRLAPPTAAGCGTMPMSH